MVRYYSLPDLQHFKVVWLSLQRIAMNNVGAEGQFCSCSTATVHWKCSTTVMPTFRCCGPTSPRSDTATTLCWWAERSCWSAPPGLSFPACLARRTQSGRHSVCQLSCGWCSCGSSSAGHGSVSRSSSWVCSYTGPSAWPPAGGWNKTQCLTKWRRDIDSVKTWVSVLKWHHQNLNDFCLTVTEWVKKRRGNALQVLTSVGSDILNSQPSPVQEMKVRQAESKSSSSKNCHSWIGPEPKRTDGGKKDMSWSILLVNF